MLLAGGSTFANSNNGSRLRVPLPLAPLKTLPGFNRKAFIWVAEQSSAQREEFGTWLQSFPRRLPDAICDFLIRGKVSCEISYPLLRTCLCPQTSRLPR